MIPHNRPTLGHEESQAAARVLSSGWIAQGEEVLALEQEFGEYINLPAENVVAVSSGSAALYMSLTIANAKNKYVSASAYSCRSIFNAIQLSGGIPNFLDVEEASVNASLKKSNADIYIIAHMFGLPDLNVEKKRSYFLVEDAAQAIDSYYKGRPLGSIGTFGTFSFHETKNIISGEGGMLVINDDRYIPRAEIIREKGTNRSSFFRGEVDKYGWVDIGSSFLPSDIVAAYLYAQLEQLDSIQSRRKDIWQRYYDKFSALQETGKILLPSIPDGSCNNAHMFYIKAKDLQERTALISFLKENGIQAVFHYIPLHSAPAGKKFGRFNGEDKYTTRESERLMRLPMYYGLKDEEVQYIISKVKEFYK